MTVCLLASLCVYLLIRNRRELGALQDETGRNEIKAHIFMLISILIVTRISEILTRVVHLRTESHQIQDQISSRKKLGVQEIKPVHTIITGKRIMKGN